jgi:hypothetical protein
MIIHKSLAEGRWFEFAFIDQMANIGTDVERMLNWRKRGKIESSENALLRALELLEFTIQDPKNARRRKELGRIKELLLDYFYGDNKYGYTDQAWSQYFYFFAIGSARARGL